jgi:hypothetical protein
MEQSRDDGVLSASASGEGAGAAGGERAKSSPTSPTAGQRKPGSTRHSINNVAGSSLLAAARRRTSLFVERQRSPGGNRHVSGGSGGGGGENREDRDARDALNKIKAKLEFQSLKVTELAQ